jgi:hypothetical protein
VAPAVGLLWTPGYWGWNDGVYAWRSGYWGPRVGFYGGINYGYGYTGVGYQGGYWNSGVFMQNTAVVNVGTVHITNVYNKTVITNTTVTKVSFNGGTGGTIAKPNAQELAAANDKHAPATHLQTQHEHAAGNNHALLASVNHGKPIIAATAKARQFAGQGIVAAKGFAAAKSPNAAGLGPKPPGQFNAVAKSSNAGGLGPKPPPQFKAAKMLGPPAPKGPPPRQGKRPGHPSNQGGRP